MTDEDSHLGARNTWPDDSKELGSKDCISVTRKKRECEMLLVSLDVNLNTLSPCTHTGAAASHRSDLPWCSTHCRMVIPDRDCRWQHPDRIPVWMVDTKRWWVLEWINLCLQASLGHSWLVFIHDSWLSIRSPVVCSIDRSPGVTPVDLIDVALQR